MMPISRSWIIGIESVIAFGVLSHAAHGQSLPPDILACAREPASDKRLECFDRQVARYADQAAISGGASPPSSESANGASPSAAGVTQPHSVSQPLSPSSGNGATPVVAAATANSPSDLNNTPKHVAAKIVSIKGSPDAAVLSLDNGQVWRQVQEASADLNLHPGDSVTIDRQLGSYWLSGTRGAAMKVRRTQ